MPRNKIEFDILKHAALFTFTMRGWGNRAKGSLEQIDSGDASKDRLSLSKKLIDAQEYRDLRKFQYEVKAWCISRAMPSFIRPGVFMVALTEVPEYEKYLAQAKAQLATNYVPALLNVYQAKKEASKEMLGEQYNEADYPQENELAHAFSIEHAWITFGTPEALPPEIKAREQAKMRKKMLDAQEQILAALRASYKGVVEHMVERLTPKDGKVIIRESLVTNFQEFLDTFAAKNLMQDEALAELVEKSREILKDVSPRDLRKDAKSREKLIKEMNKVKTAVDGLVAERPQRKFNFDEE